MLAIIINNCFVNFIVVVVVVIYCWKVEMDLRSTEEWKE